MNPLRCFSLFDTLIASDVDLLSAVEGATRSADLHIARVDAPLSVSQPALHMPLWLPDGIVQYAVYADDDALVLRFLPYAEFRVTRSSIQYRLLADTSPETLVWILVGSILGVWLDYVGLPVLHGAAAEVDSRAVAFAGDCGVGKSTFIASWLQDGYRVFGDDQLALEDTSTEFLVRPAVPWLKVNRDVAAFLNVRHEELPLLHPSVQKRRLDIPATSRVIKAQPLARIYMLERLALGEDQVSIVRVPAGEAMRELIRHSYAPRTVEAAGLQQRRLPQLARLAAQVGVWRLRYPTGLDRLAAVRSAVVAHLADGK